MALAATRGLGLLAEDSILAAARTRYPLSLSGERSVAPSCELGSRLGRDGARPDGVR